MSIMKYCMSRLVVLLFCICLFGGCDDEQRIDFSKLPSSAQAFIEQFFSTDEVVYIEREKDDGHRNYEVVLSTGTKIAFDESGNWTSVSCGFSRLPDGILPASIAVHMAEKYPQLTPYKVEKEYGGYKVSVAGNVELLYSSDGQFIREQAD